MENQYVVSISHAAVGGLLHSNELKPHLSKYWCIPKQNDAAFVANMEDVLGIYQLPYRREAPVVCMDEKPLQLPKPGYCEKIDSEYVRCGTAGIFMFTEPLKGVYTISITRLSDNTLSRLCQTSLYIQPNPFVRKGSVSFETCSSYFNVIEILCIKYMLYLKVKSETDVQPFVKDAGAVPVREWEYRNGLI